MGTNRDAAAGSTGPLAQGLLVGALVLTAASLATFLASASGPRVEPGLAGAYLWLYLALFGLRVAGQVLVRVRAPRWLPPMEQWNLVPYPLLLPIQVVLLVLLAWTAVDLTRGLGPFAHPDPTAGAWLVGFSCVYAAAMLVRYAVRMARRPDQRWWGGTIPIVFHLVLAAFAFTLGRYHASY